MPIGGYIVVIEGGSEPVEHELIADAGHPIIGERISLDGSSVSGRGRPARRGSGEPRVGAAHLCSGLRARSGRGRQSAAGGRPRGGAAVRRLCRPEADVGRASAVAGRGPRRRRLQRAEADLPDRPAPGCAARASRGSLDGRARPRAVAPVAAGEAAAPGSRAVRAGATGLRPYLAFFREATVGGCASDVARGSDGFGSPCVTRLVPRNFSTSSIDAANFAFGTSRASSRKRWRT